MRAIRRISDALARRPDLVLWLIAAYYALAVILRVLFGYARVNEASP